jgi:transposase
VRELLRKIAAMGLRVPETLVLDNAHYQKCRLVHQLAEELEVELLFLPSYSPNLNVIERPWKFIKKKVLNSKYYDNFTAFRAAMEGCIADAPTKHQEELASLLTHQFQTLEKSQLLAA